jgi:hypothetical protein
MPRIDLDYPNVHHVAATPDDIRGESKEFADALELAMDEAQGEVFSDAEKVSFVVIEIRKK